MILIFISYDITGNFARNYECFYYPCGLFCMDNMAPPWIHGLHTGTHHQEAEKDQLIIKYSNINPK